MEPPAGPRLNEIPITAGEAVSRASGKADVEAALKPATPQLQLVR
jgi:hypothetical protein